MNKQLRKKHLQVWTILLFALPAIIIGGWLSIKKPVSTSSLLQPVSTNVLPVIIKSIKKENYTVNLRTNNDKSSTQLEWINKSAITAPSAIIYKLTPGNKGTMNNNEIIGRIDSRGSYQFALKNDSAAGNHFILYDFIHKQIIDSINF
ncbi:MAG: hypothetical protein ABI402_09065 [Ferruginibacter sp.]